MSIDLAPTAMVEKHPDWFIRNKDGAIPNRGGMPGFSDRFHRLANLPAIIPTSFQRSFRK